MTRNHYNGSHAAIIVYSIDKLSTFKSVDDFYNSITQICNEDIKVFIVGNKCDLQSERHVQWDDLEEKAAQLGDCAFFETSALPDKKETID